MLVYVQTFLLFLWQNFRCHSQSYYPTTAGKPGILGRNGTDGENGDDGQKGDIGLKGKKGGTGDVGDDGMEGEDGDPVSWNFKQLRWQVLNNTFSLLTFRG